MNAIRFQTMNPTSSSPGNYSAILKSDSSTAQEALVEAYEIAN